MLADAIFAFLGVTTTVKFVANHSEEEDRKSFRWYEVWYSTFIESPCINFCCLVQLWLIFAHVLPIFERMSRGEIFSPPSLSFNLSFAA